jgi:hypothetical protein
MKYFVLPSTCTTFAQQFIFYDNKTDHGGRQKDYFFNGGGQ